MCASAALLRRDATEWREQLSTISCEVDYARGGGSSGAMVRENNDATLVTRGRAGRSGGALTTPARATTKPAAHDAKS
jgi:hypothetical protein